MNKIKILTLLVLLLVFAWVGNQLNNKISANKKYAVDLENVQAAALNEHLSFIPIIFRDQPILKDPTIFGVEMYEMTDNGGLDKMNKAGIYWVRHNDTNPGPETSALIWTAVEPNQGDRNWTRMAELESQLINAASVGNEVILVIRSTPRWARDARWPDAYCGPIDETHYDDFAKFTYDAVKRYSVPPYNVKYWELYNEPDYPINSIGYPYGIPHGCWGTWQLEDNDDPYGNGSAYGEMLKVVYPKIKKADPLAQVLIGGVLLECDPRKQPPDYLKSQCEIAGHPVEHEDYARFFEGILISGAREYFDGISFHSYDFYPQELSYVDFGQYYNFDWNSAWNNTGPVLVAKVEYIKELLQAYNVTGKEIFNTESALINSHPDHIESGGICKPFHMPYERTKASHIVQTYTYAKVLRLRANIYYSVRGWRCSALLEGSKNTPVQPAYDTYKFAAKKLGPANYVKEINSYPNVKIFKFQDPDSKKKFWVIWSHDGYEHPITLPNTPSAVWNMAGKSKPVTGKSFNVTLGPQYIQY